MILRLGWATACVLIALPASAQVTGRVRGIVSDSAGAPIEGAEVRGRENGVSVVTGGGGRFEITATAGAPLTLEARRVGYAPASLGVRVGPGETVDVVIVLARLAQRLPTVKVEGRDAADRKLVDFERRRRGVSGRFLTAAEISGRHASRTSDLLRAIPGVRVATNPPGVPGGTEVRLARCREASGVAVWIDGFRQRGDTTSPDPRERQNLIRAMVGDMLDRVAPSQIAAMEIYVGVSQIPAEFRENSCAAIVIWTK